MHFSSMCTREDASSLPIGLPETTFNIPKTAILIYLFTLISYCVAEMNVLNYLSIELY